MTKIQQYLNKSEASASRDKTTFQKYKDKSITISECLTEFYQNNLIKKNDQKINVNDFEEWLKSLGY